MTWSPYDPCPCGCEVIGWKLTKLLPGETVQHVVGCKCRRHLGKRSQKAGKATQAKGHRALGGTGFTPSNEESARPYEVTVMPEHKGGKQIPTSWAKFVGTDWFRRALRQSERAAPVGAGVRPSVMLSGRWLIVDMGGRREPTERT